MSVTELIHLVVADVDSLDPAGFARLRAAVPIERRERSDRYLRLRDQYSSVVVYSLLQHLWSEVETGPMPPVQIGPYGKPQFGFSGWHFNWSHDGRLCVCVLARVPVGVDVQTRLAFDAGLFVRMATPAELDLRAPLAADGDLSVLWTRKEALVKLSGRGLSTPLTTVEAWAGAVVTWSSPAYDARISLAAEQMAVACLRRRTQLRLLAPTADGRWRSERSDLRELSNFGGSVTSGGRSQQGSGFGEPASRLCISA